MQNPYHKSADTGRERSLLTRPLSAYSIPRGLIYVLGFVGLVYLLNPSMGVFELLPDNLPIVGNLDEGIATLLIWSSLVEMFEGRKYRDRNKPQSPDQPENRK